MKKFFFIFFFSILFFGFVSSASAYVAASPNYRLEKDSLNVGGTDFSTSGNYGLSDTLGELASGLGFGGLNNASTGYRYMEIDPAAVVPPVPGCIDPRACNYNPLATQDDHSCTYNCHPPQPIGCTDKVAINYNPIATADNGTCHYQLNNFKAKYDEVQKAILLTWENPPLTKFQSIVIVRGWVNSPVGLVKIYEGKGERTLDSNVQEGQHYYYTAFVLNNDNSFSDGRLADEVVPWPPGKISGCTDPAALNYNPRAELNDDSCRYGEDGGPFSFLPPAASSLNVKWELSFIQPAESVKTFDWRGIVRLAGAKPVTVRLKFSSIVSSLKTIGVTLTDPYDKNKSYSFLMHRSADGITYEAMLSPLLKRGLYPIDIYIINYENQTMQHIKGRLVIPNTAFPWLTTAGLFIGFLPLLIDLWNLLIRVFSYFLGRRRHDKPWGTVYDSETKQPLDPVYVTAEVTGPDGKMKEMASAITDIDGRYSFFLPDGTYYFKANKTHYKFPSSKLEGREWDELYRNLYFGSPIVVTSNNVVNLNIPMDSVDFDWNEFAKTKTNFFRFYDRRKLWLNRLYKLFFGFGFILSIYAIVFDFSLPNIIITLLYVGIIIYNIFWRDKYKPLRVFRESTGEPLSFAILRVFIPNLNQQIKQVVADKFGRFYLLVRPGVYYYTVEEKLPDGSYIKVYQSEPINFKDGILTRDVSVK